MINKPQDLISMTVQLLLKRERSVFLVFTEITRDMDDEFFSRY